MANSKRKARRAAGRKAEKAYRRGQVRQQRRVSQDSVDRGRSAAHGYTAPEPPVAPPTEEEINPGYSYDPDADYAEITIELCEGCFKDGDEINIEDPFDPTQGVNLFVNDSFIRSGHHCQGGANDQRRGLWKKIVWKIPPELHKKLLEHKNIEPGPRALDLRQWKD